MRFFLDFEATRFSNKIISIGCVSDNGKTFQTLVKPVNKAKVDNFITELTGITKSMLENAPTADEAFNKLFDFIELNNGKEEPKYFCYGNSDISYIKNTLKYMRDTRACVCAQAIAGNLINYADVVKDFFTSSHELALRKVYMLIKSETELVQKHDSLEDALMLQTIAKNLRSKCKPEDREKISAMPSQRIFIHKTTKVPQLFLEWDSFSKWKAKTGADESNWLIKCVDKHTKKCKYFNDFNTAALWVIKYIASNISPKKEENIKKIANALTIASKTGRCRYNCYWECFTEEKN